MANSIVFCKKICPLRFLLHLIHYSDYQKCTAYYNCSWFIESGLLKAVFFSAIIQYIEFK